MRIPALAVIAATLLGLTVPAAGRARHGTEITGFGVWSLRQLGYGDQTISIQEPNASISLPFELPAGAAQGGSGTWYVVHMHAIVRFCADAHFGEAVVSAATNDRAVVQAIFKPIVMHGQTAVRWSTLDLLHGLVARVTTDQDIEVLDENYAQIQGVRPGANTLNFKVEQYDGVCLASVTVLSDSAIEVTDLGPGRLDANLALSRPHFRVQRKFTARYVVRRIEGRPPEQVTLFLHSDDKSLRILGRSERSFSSVVTQVLGDFELLATRRGVFELTLTVHSSSSNPTATALVRVR